MLALEIVKEYFPKISDKEADYILWSKTGFPGFLMYGETSLREQLKLYSIARKYGADVCYGCGRVFKGASDMCKECNVREG